MDLQENQQKRRKNLLIFWVWTIIHFYWTNHYSTHLHNFRIELSKQNIDKRLGFKF